MGEALWCPHTSSFGSFWWVWQGCRRLSGVSQWHEKLWSLVLGPASLVTRCHPSPGWFSTSGGKWPVGTTTVWLMWFWFCWWRRSSARSGKVERSGRCGPLPPRGLRDKREGAVLWQQSASEEYLHSASECIFRRECLFPPDFMLPLSRMFCQPWRKRLPFLVSCA